MAAVTSKNTSEKSHLPPTWNPIITLLQRRRSNKLKKQSVTNDSGKNAKTEEQLNKKSQQLSSTIIQPYVKTTEKKNKQKDSKQIDVTSKHIEEEIVIEKALDLNKDEGTAKTKFFKSLANDKGNNVDLSVQSNNVKINKVDLDSTNNVINNVNLNDKSSLLNSFTRIDSDKSQIPTQNNEDKLLVDKSNGAYKGNAVLDGKLEMKVEAAEVERLPNGSSEHFSKTKQNEAKIRTEDGNLGQRKSSSGNDEASSDFCVANGNLKSPNSERKWNPAHASYRHKKYENRPLKIENYEPGKSSIVLKDPFANHYFNPPIEKPGENCKYTNAKSSLEYKIQRKGDGLKCSSANVIHESYMSVQRGGDIPLTGLRPPTPPKKDHTFMNSTYHSIYEEMRHSSCSGARSPDMPPRSALPLYEMGSKSPIMIFNPEHVIEDGPSLSQLVHTASVRSVNRKTKDEINFARKKELDRLLEQARHKRLMQEEEANNARRHSDFYRPSSMSPVALNRYSDAFLNRSNSFVNSSGSATTRRRVRAKVLYKFQPQNPRELHLEVGNIVYVWRCVDDNWYEGEHHGSVGIFPVTYVQILQSELDGNVFEGQCCQVRYDFEAKDSAEISVKKGDQVVIKERIDENWVKVVHSHQLGVIPISYLLSIPFSTLSISEINMPEMGDMNSSLGSLLSTNCIELNVDEVITNKPFKSEPLTSTPEQRHMANSSDKLIESNATVSPVDFSRYLLVPSNSGGVNKEKNENSTPLIKKETANDLLPFVVCEVVHNYEPEDKDELKLEPGDLIDVTEVFDDGWYVGISHSSGLFGTFPGNYVKKYVLK